ncbi:MAG: hypothetical protein L0287_13570, partial [Anaerolineae bacterium]|nr:hypothetical protein [Anaerolineae bacterium]
MNSRKQMLLAIPLIILSISLHRSEAEDVQALLSKAAAKDQTVFSTTYLHAAFSDWQDRFHLEQFQVDSVFAKGEYDEVWLRKAGASETFQHRLALLINRQAGRKIVEVRQLLITERQGLNPVEQELVEFIERFAWMYEIGNENFIQDFLYPSHIRLRFAGSSDENAILSKLRARFKDILPVRSIEWEGRNFSYVIRAVLDSPLQPLEISVDIQKHITANFFEIAGKPERLQALKDSMMAWSGAKKIFRDQTELTVEASSALQALANALQENFKEFRLVLLDSTETSIDIEAMLPFIERLQPAALRFRLAAVQSASGAYSIRSSLLPSRGEQNDSDDQLVFSSAIDQSIH